MTRLTNTNSSIKLSRDDYYLSMLKQLKRMVIYSIDDSELSVDLYHQIYGTSGDMELEEIPYHINLTGELSPLDTAITIRSLDTGGLVTFTRSSLVNHPITLNAYRNNETLRYNLIRDNYRYKTLIYGVLSDVTFSDLFNVQHLQILYVPEGLLAENEYTIIHQLQSRLYQHRDRWYLPAYTLVDELYASAYASTLYSAIPGFLLTIRENMIYSNEVHPYFITAKLLSHGISESNINALSFRQQLYLYKNIEWLRKHQGTNKVLRSLLEGLFLPADINLYAVNAVIANGDNVIQPGTQITFETIETEPVYQVIDLKTGGAVTSMSHDDYIELENTVLLNEEVSIASREQAVRLLHRSRGRTSLLLSQYAITLSLRDTDRMVYALSLLVATAGTKYTAVVGYNGVTLPTEQWTTLILLHQLYLQGNLPTVIPSIIEVHGVYLGDPILITDTLLQTTTVAEMGLTELLPITQLNDSVAFSAAVDNAITVKESLTLAKTGITHTEISQVEWSIFNTQSVTLAGAGTSVANFLDQAGVSYSEITSLPYMNGLFLLLTGIEPDQTATKATYQSAAVSIVKQFLSYERDVIVKNEVTLIPSTQYSQQGTFTVDFTELTEVPVRLYNGYSLLGTTGEMNIEFTDLMNNTLIEWELLEGSVDTIALNSSNDEASFTSDNADYKVFKVYTNRGTEYEQSSTARYYHHPIDQHSGQSILDGDTVAQVNPHYPDSNDFNNDITAGMVPIDSELLNYDTINRAISGLYSFTGIDENYNELTLNQTFIQGHGLVVREIVLYKETGSTWSFLSTHSGSTETILKFAVTGGRCKAVIQMYRGGYEWFVELIFNNAVTPGITTKVDPEKLLSGDTSTTGDVNTVLSKILTLSTVDYYKMVGTDTSKIADVNTVLQNIMKFNYSDSHTLQVNKVSTLGSIETFLSTIINVT